MVHNLLLGLENRGKKKSGLATSWSEICSAVNFNRLSTTVLPFSLLKSSILSALDFSCGFFAISIQKHKFPADNGKVGVNYAVPLCICGENYAVPRFFSLAGDDGKIINFPPPA